MERLISGFAPGCVMRVRMESASDGPSYGQVQDRRPSSERLPQMNHCKSAGMFRQTAPAARKCQAVTRRRISPASRPKPSTPDSNIVSESGSGVVKVNVPKPGSIAPDR